MNRFQLLSLRDTSTESVLMKCHNPLSSTEPCSIEPVWGTNDYTLDSDICTAIRHVASKWDAEMWVFLTYQEMRPDDQQLQVFEPSLHNQVQTFPWVEAYPITFHLSENLDTTTPTFPFPFFKEEHKQPQDASTADHPRYRQHNTRDYNPTQVAEWTARTVQGKPLSKYNRGFVANHIANLARANGAAVRNRDHLQPELIGDNLVTPPLTQSLLEVAFSHARRIRNYLAGHNNKQETKSSSSPSTSSADSTPKPSSQTPFNSNPQQRFRQRR